MLKLVEKRNALIAEYDALKEKLNVEKRSAFSNEEFESVNNLKIQIEEIDKQIAVEKNIEEKRNFKLDSIEAPSIVSPAKNLVTEFRSFLQSGKIGEKFTMPYEERATITTSSNSQFKYTDMYEGLSINNADLVLESLGAKKLYFESGAVDFPSIANIVASVGTEDTTVSDQTLSSAKVTLTPQFISASLEVSKLFLTTSKPKNISDLMAELAYAIDKKVEQITINSTSGLSATTGATLYDAVVKMEAAVNGSITGYIFSKTGVAKAKNSKIGTDQGMVWQNGYVNGYPAKRSTLIPNAGHAIAADFSSFAMAYFGNGIQIEMITDATLARKGNVLLIATAMATGSYLDANKLAVCKTVSTLS